MSPKPLTAHSTIRDWTADPEGRRLLSELLAASGRDVSALEPAASLSLQRLVSVGNGLVTQEAVDDLVRAANGGVVPETTDTDPTTWVERINVGRFDGQTVVVTGAGAGIGEATASRIAREGGRVIAVDVLADRLTALVTEHGNGIVPVAADISSQADIDRVVAAADGRIDALANIAGVMDDFSPLHEVKDEMWQRVFAVNVDGMFRLTRAVLPLMLTAGRGSIVNIASEAALRGSSAGLAYTMSKHAVVGMTKSAAYMYGASGIRVNAVAPGATATKIVARFGSEFGRERLAQARTRATLIAEARQVAASITFLLSDDGTNINGVLLPSDGGESVV